MSIFEADNVSEAVRMAAEFKRRGSHDWFRGQVSNWPLKSSFVRLSAQGREHAQQKLIRFQQWLSNTPGLEDLSNNVDSGVAVAQHYSLPTNFVDFTTEPRIAGFFASDGEPISGMLSCIMCVNTKDVKAFWQNLPPSYVPPEFISLDVSNLWRLEAQSGKFLFCPYDNFEFIYDLDRIVFPYIRRLNSPSRDEVYPSRKSHLETLLDHYFMVERLIEGEQALSELDVYRNRYVLEAPPNNCDAELISGGNIPREQSWDANILDAWLQPTVERYRSAITNDQAIIAVKLQDDLDSIRDGIAESIAERLENDPRLRGKLVLWRFDPEDAKVGSKVSTEFLVVALQRLWDGLRSLPCSDEDIGVAMGNCVAMYLAKQRITQPKYNPWLEAASSCFGPSLEIEMGANDGSYSRGYVSRVDLLTAVRSDIGHFLSPAWRDRIVNNITGLLGAVQAPDRLFVFERLSKVLASQIAPSQVLTRPRGAVFFSAAR